MQQVIECHMLYTTTNYLGLPQEYSESVNRKTDITMINREITKIQPMVDKTLQRKLKIEQHEPHKKQRELR